MKMSLSIFIFNILKLSKIDTTFTGFYLPDLIVACAAASLAIGTRYGLQDT